MSGVQVVVVVLAVVLVTAVVSCVLGNSKMGARLWSERRSSRAAHPTSASPHAHAAVTPTAFTHSLEQKRTRERERKKTKKKVNDCTIDGSHSLACTTASLCRQRLGRTEHTHPFPKAGELRHRLQLFEKNRVVGPPFAKQKEKGKPLGRPR